MRRVLLIATCLIPGLAWAQEDDRDYLTAFLEDTLSDAGRQVTVTGFEGALSSRATMASLTIADDKGVWITLNGVVLDWSRSALLRGVVDVAELSAREIVLERVPEAGESAPSACCCSCRSEWSKLSFRDVGRRFTARPPVVSAMRRAHATGGFSPNLPSSP